MEQQVERIAGSQLRVTFKLNQAERAEFETRALRHLGEHLTLSGFRPGRAPLELVKQRVEAEALRHELMLQAFREGYPKLVVTRALEVVGEPELQFLGDDPFSFSVRVSALPEVDLGKWHKVKLSRQPVSVESSEVTQIITELRDGRATEVAVDRPAALGDKVEVDFEVSVDQVVIDGGRATKYPLVLGKHVMIPGFEENLVGLLSSEEKVFEITFPADYRKDLAGRRAQVRVKLHQILARTLPEANDDFARGLGKFESLTDLETKLRQNLLEERQASENDRLERELFEALLKVVRFGELPEVLLVGEAEKMLRELADEVKARGLDWAMYLQTLKRDEAALKAELRPQAEKRVKVALMTRAFAKQEKLEADEVAVEQELSRLLDELGDDARAAAQFETDDYRAYLKHALTNRRVVEWLKQKLVA